MKKTDLDTAVSAYREKKEQALEKIPDEVAVEAADLYDKWEPGKHYVKGKRFQYGGELWRVEQEHDSLEQYPPSIHTAALYSKIEKPGEGDTPAHPIHYSGNMELFKGKYYEQAGVIYRCIRDSGVPIYADLSALVNNYVEVYTP